MNSLVRSQVERQPIKKWQNVSSSKISDLVFAKLSYKKNEVHP
jgi:hypothetical protein